MQVVAYFLENLNVNSNVALNFKDEDEKNFFFNSKGTLLDSVEVTSFIKNIWNLENELTIFDEGRTPPNYNYLRVKDTTDKYHYFYITDYEDLGRNQIKYYLLKDTITTHVLNSGDTNILSNKQVVLREHKNRFKTIDGWLDRVYYDPTIEDISFTPTKVKLVDKIDRKDDPKRILSLQSYGGDDAKSEQIYGYEVYGGTSSNTSYWSEFRINLGWGVEIDKVGSSGSINFLWVSNENESPTHIMIDNNIGIGTRIVHFKYKDSEEKGVAIRGNTEELNSHNISISGNAAIKDYNNNNINLIGDGYLIVIFEEGQKTSFNIIYNTGVFFDKPAGPAAINTGTFKTFAFYDYENETLTPFSKEQLDLYSSFNRKILEIPYNFKLPRNTFKTKSGAIMSINEEIETETRNLTLDLKDFEKSGNPLMPKIPLNDPKIFTSQFNPYFVSWLGESFNVRTESLKQRLLYNDVPSRNIAMPDLTGKEYLGNGVYRLYNNDGVTFDYNVLNGVFTLNGTATSLKQIIKLYLDNNYKYTLSYIYENGLISGPLSLNFYQDGRGGYGGIPLNSHNYTSIKNAVSEIGTNNFRIYVHNRVIYDNFQFKLQLEKGTEATDYVPPIVTEVVDLTGMIDVDIDIDKTTYSKILLSLNNEYIEEEKLNEYKKIITLDNEVTTIQSDFNSYLHNLYENEKKLEDLQLKKAQRKIITNTITDVTSIGAGIVGGFVVGNVPGAIVGGVSGAVRAVNSGVSNFLDYRDLNEELRAKYQNKMNELQMSLINISGGGPDLNNKSESDIIKLYKIEVREEELNYIDNYLHNFGYNTLEIKKPNYNNRLRFNFLKMDVINESVKHQFITKEVLKDIKERFLNGVTIYHYNNGPINWDFKKELENWER